MHWATGDYGHPSCLGGSVNKGASWVGAALRFGEISRWGAIDLPLFISQVDNETSSKTGFIVMLKLNKAILEMLLKSYDYLKYM